jgi:hypothetical protein
VRRREEGEFEAEAEMFFEGRMIYIITRSLGEIGVSVAVEGFSFFLWVCRVEGNWENVLLAITRNRKGTILPENRLSKYSGIWSSGEGRGSHQKTSFPRQIREKTPDLTRRGNPNVLDKVRWLEFSCCMI